MSLSVKIFLGLALGIATGIFLGDITAPLKLVGDGFVQLLQLPLLHMTYDVAPPVPPQTFQTFSSYNKISVMYYTLVIFFSQRTFSYLNICQHSHDESLTTLVTHLMIGLGVPLA